MRFKVTMIVDFDPEEDRDEENPEGSSSELQEEIAHLLSTFGDNIEVDVDSITVEEVPEDEEEEGEDEDEA